MKEAGADASVQVELLNAVSAKLAAAKDALTRLEKAVAEAGTVDNAKEQAFFYKDTVRVVMDELRAPIDELEMIVDKEMWPVPSYADLTFEV